MKLSFNFNQNYAVPFLRVFVFEVSCNMANSGIQFILRKHFDFDYALAYESSELLSISPINDVPWIANFTWPA